MEYRTHRVQEEFCSRSGANKGPVCLELTTLASLDETIDQLFVELERSGNPQMLDELCPYFGCVWPAARGLAGALLEEPWFSRFQAGGARLLEVGCGLAIPSLIAAKLGAEVVATDLHQDVPRFLERNIVANLSAAQAARFRYVPLDWKAVLRGSVAPDLGGPFALVVGSDVLYEKEHPDSLAQALWRLARGSDGHPSASILLADPGRPYLQQFLDGLARETGRPVLTTVVSVADGAVPGGIREVFILSSPSGRLEQ